MVEGGESQSRGEGPQPRCLPSAVGGTLMDLCLLAPVDVLSCPTARKTILRVILRAPLRKGEAVRRRSCVGVQRGALLDNADPLAGASLRVDGEAICVDIF